MKIVLALLFFASPALAQQGANAIEYTVPEKTFWNHVVLQASMIGNSGADENSNYEINFGYLFTERLRLDVGYGRRTSKKISKGGDLNDWQYVEKTTTFEAEYPVIDLRYAFWVSESRKHSFYATTGLGAMKSKVNYDYNRYKPYNGFFCFLGCPEKAVEESDSGTTRVTTNFARAGLGYQWLLSSDQKISAYNLNFGLSYLKVLNPESVALGTSHAADVTTSALESVNLAVGVSLQL